MLHWRRCARRIRLALIHRHGPRCQYGRSAAAPLHVVVPRSTFNLPTFNPSPRPPPPVRPQRCCASPRCRPTFNVQRSTFNPSRLIPSPRPPPPVRPQRCCAPPRCRPTFNVQRQPSTPRASSPRHGPRCRYGRSAAAPLRRPAALSPLTSCPSRLLPLAPLASCLSPLDGAMQRCYGRRSTFQPSTPRASPLASRLLPRT